MLFGDRSCPVLPGVPDPLPDFSETSRELPARLVPGVFLRWAREFVYFEIVIVARPTT